MISTSQASPLLKRKHTRHWSFTRILHCLARSCFKASSRFDGGRCKSPMRFAAFNCISRIAARVRISVGNLRDLPVV